MSAGSVHPAGVIWTHELVTKFAVCGGSPPQVFARAHHVLASSVQSAFPHPAVASARAQDSRISALIESSGVTGARAVQPGDQHRRGRIAPNSRRLGQLDAREGETIAPHLLRPKHCRRPGCALRPQAHRKSGGRVGRCRAGAGYQQELVGTRVVLRRRLCALTVPRLSLRNVRRSQGRPACRPACRRPPDEGPSHSPLAMSRGPRPRAARAHRPAIRGGGRDRRPPAWHGLSVSSGEELQGPLLHWLGGNRPLRCSVVQPGAAGDAWQVDASTGHGRALDLPRADAWGVPSPAASWRKPRRGSERNQGR